MTFRVLCVWSGPLSGLICSYFDWGADWSYSGLICSPWSRHWKKTKPVDFKGSFMSRTIKYTVEQKIRAAERYIRGEASASGIAAEMEMPASGERSVREWAAIYRENGIEGFNLKDGNRSYTAEEKQRAVEDYLQDQNLGQGTTHKGGCGIRQFQSVSGSWGLSRLARYVKQPTLANSCVGGLFGRLHLGWGLRLSVQHLWRSSPPAEQWGNWRNHVVASHILHFHPEKTKNRSPHQKRKKADLLSLILAAFGLLFYSLLNRHLKIYSTRIIETILESI